MSMILSQSKVQQSAGLAITKLAMDTSKEISLQMTKMISNMSVDPNLGQHLDVRV
nr:YjfB family protein [Clostridium rhizosphaerae]